jgi:diguanylate cyclase (GGDEF)-like protein
VALFSLHLQLGTLLPILLGITLVRVLVMGHYALHRKVYPGFRTMILAELLVFVGMLVFFLRDRAGLAPPVVFLTNVVILSHSVLIYHGLGAYGRLPRLRAGTWQNSLFILAVGLLQTADVLFDPSMPRRVVIFSAAALLLTLRIGLELPWRCRRRLPGLKLLCASYLGLAFFHVLRAVNAGAVPGDSFAALLQTDVVAAYSIAYRILQSVLELYVVFAMNSTMLEDDLQLATSQIERMAQTDSLTGALNRRGLEILGRAALRRSYAQSAPAALIMFDLDWFKRVNDTLGHAAGDELLRDMAVLCRKSLRSEDVFARYGGEEFVVVAPCTDAREARLLAERIRQAVEDALFPVTGGKRVTASFGVASARGATLAELLQDADEALYTAKQSGRNQVILSVPEMAARDIEGDEA